MEAPFFVPYIVCLRAKGCAYLYKLVNCMP